MLAFHPLPHTAVVNMAFAWELLTAWDKSHPECRQSSRIKFLCAGPQAHFHDLVCSAGLIYYVCTKNRSTE